MNKIVTSKEKLLAAAQALVAEQGLRALNIRTLASECGVAVGSIYNYYPTKSALVAEVLSSFWEKALDPQTCALREGERFPQFYGRIFLALSERVKTFRGCLSEDAAALGPPEKAASKRLEARCFGHIQRIFVHALESDAAISAGFWTASYPKEAFSAFAFHTMLGLLRREADSCAFFQETLERLLYKS